MLGIVTDTHANEAIPRPLYLEPVGGRNKLAASAVQWEGAESVWYQGRHTTERHLGMEKGQGELPGGRGI